MVFFRRQTNSPVEYIFRVESALNYLERIYLLFFSGIETKNMESDFKQNSIILLELLLIFGIHEENLLRFLKACIVVKRISVVRSNNKRDVITSITLVVITVIIGT